jgi:hypothetical protein
VIPEFKLYPNPATEVITIEGNGQLIIFDLTGRVRMEMVIKDEKSIDLSQLSSGIYFARMNNNVMKFIRQ